MAEKALSRGEIFVVDDDPAVRDTLSMVLSAGGYQVICFADGAALLAAVHSHPDAVSIDTVAPPPPAAMLAAVGVKAYTHPGVVGN